jgi:HD-GYP domain-containing protein (c-di-GMP phosphodiesterase class II)
VLETAWRTYRDERYKTAHRLELEKALQRQTRRVRKTFLSAITSLVRTVEERDAYTAGHSSRVRDYALSLGTRSACSARAVESAPSGGPVARHRESSGSRCGAEQARLR